MVFFDFMVLIVVVSFVMFFGWIWVSYLFRVCGVLVGV